MSDTLVVESDTSRTPLKQFFGITDSYDTGYGDDLDYIDRWATDRKLSREDMLIELKKIEQKLGQVQPGENRYHRIKHYLSLDKKLTDTLKEMSAYEKSWSGMV